MENHARTRLVGWVIMIILLVIIFMSATYTVQPGEVAFIVRFGEIRGQAQPQGFHWKSPFMDNVEKISIKDNLIESTETSASKDLQDVSTRVALNFAIEKDSVIQLYQEVGKLKPISNILIVPAIKESVKAVTARYTAEELVTKREEVRNAIVETLKSKLEHRGIRIIEVNITDFSFSASFNAAIEDKVRAEQEALAEQNKLEKEKFIAEQMVVKAQAEAEAIRIQAQAITSQGGKDYVSLKWIESWNGELPTIISDGNGFLLDIGSMK